MESTFRILSLSRCLGLATLWPQHMSAYAQEAVFGPAFGGAHGEDHVAGAKVWAKGVAGRQALARAPPEGVRAANAVGVFTTFDVPGAGTGGAQGTYPTAINPEGAITGWYADSNYGYHGFLRAAGGAFAYRVFVRAGDGSFTTFDAATYPPCCNPGQDGDLVPRSRRCGRGRALVGGAAVIVQRSRWNPPRARPTEG
jgi:hypothetical protein